MALITIVAPVLEELHLAMNVKCIDELMFFFCLISRYFDERLVGKPEISFREGHGGKEKFDSISRISADERGET